MQISVTFRQIEPSEALRNYVTERLKKFKRYLDGPVEAHVVLGLEKFRHLADVTIDSNGRMIKGREENSDMYAAIDLVMDKIDMQLRRSSGKTPGSQGRQEPDGGPGRARQNPSCPPSAAARSRCRPWSWPTPWRCSKPRGSHPGLYRRRHRDLLHPVPPHGWRPWSWSSRY